MTGRGEQSTRDRWNERYRRRDVGALGRVPSRWLVAHRTLLGAQRGGRALDLGCGDGRNALFVAELGFEVDAIDISDVALEHLRTAADERRLPVRVVRADLETATFPHPSYEVILVFNFLQRSLFERIERSLAPGGLLLFETWRQDPSGRRRALEPGELVSAFPTLEILEQAERDVGQRQKEAIVARRPPRRPEP